METLRELFRRLNLNATLVITDINTGAGYILAPDDIVVIRWGSFKEGIRLLQALLA